MSARPKWLGAAHEGAMSVRALVGWLVRGVRGQQRSSICSTLSKGLFAFVVISYRPCHHDTASTPTNTT
jgi:hypothetical protein